MDTAEDIERRLQPIDLALRNDQQLRANGTPKFPSVALQLANALHESSIATMEHESVKKKPLEADSESTSVSEKPPPSLPRTTNAESNNDQHGRLGTNDDKDRS